MKYTLVLLIICLISCQGTKSELADFTNFDTFDEQNRFRIEAYIHDRSDCGEWSGHKEKIVVFKTGDYWRLMYTRSPNDCKAYFPDREETPIGQLTDFELNLDTNDLNALKSFVYRLEEYTPQKHLSSNATDDYIIVLRDGRITKSFETIDSSNHFTGYFELRAYLTERFSSTN